jgi:hypothetical protein
MSRYRSIAPYLLPLVCVATVSCVAAQSKQSGSEPYTPTKVEWLALSFNVEKHEWASLYRDISVAAEPDVKSANTVLLRVCAKETASDVHIGQVLRHARVAISTIALQKGFDEWLRIEEELQKTPWPISDAK